MSTPEWITPGADVVAISYLNGADGPRSATKHKVVSVARGIATLDDGSEFNARTRMKELERPPLATVLANPADPSVAETVRELDRERAAGAIKLYSGKFNEFPTEARARNLMDALKEYLGE